MNTFYLINLLIYASVDAMACLGLNQQFGVAGIANFGFIIFQAAGGDAAAVLPFPPHTAHGGGPTPNRGAGPPLPPPWARAAPGRRAGARAPPLPVRR